MLRKCPQKNFPHHFFHVDPKLFERVDAKKYVKKKLHKYFLRIFYFGQKDVDRNKIAKNKLKYFLEKKYKKKLF